MKRNTILAVLLLIALGQTEAQLLQANKKMTRQDTLRGSIGAGRSWWDVQHYHITVQPDYQQQTIQGRNIIEVAYTTAEAIMQIDLQMPMEIDSLFADTRAGVRQALSFTREGNVYWVDTKNLTGKKLDIFFHGKPRKAVNAPWDGGWIWKKDSQGNPWMSVACQGLGASVWYPCKDHQSDEPNRGAQLSVIVPGDLVAVGNGRNIEQTKLANGLVRWTWEVKSPINTYNIVPYIGKYAHFSEVYAGLKGNLDCDYWVLEANLEKAKTQFTQVKSMLQCFEHWFGPYPFYEDSYKLVESPHLGMEHQSAVAYGNQYKNGYLGTDLSGSGWGKKWDYILIHESGHEWFANSISTQDIADMWVHEGFTDYSETLYTECLFGKEAGADYVTGLRKGIQNDKPIIGPYGVNEEGSGDMYSKGANIIHTIRTMMNNDEQFRQMLVSMNKKFYHQTITSAMVEQYIIDYTKLPLQKFFHQYLRTTQIPMLRYRWTNNKWECKWENTVPDFRMKTKLLINDKPIWVDVTDEWKTVSKEKGNLALDRNVYALAKVWE
jgi:aminopeptidase N